MIRVYDFSTMPRAIIMEGADLSGKTTTAKAMEEYFRLNTMAEESQGNPFYTGEEGDYSMREVETHLPRQMQPLRTYYVRNPGGSARAESLRNAARQKDVDVWEQADLYLQAFEATMEHIRYLNHRYGNNILYIVDRWYPSLQIYQFAHMRSSLWSMTAKSDNLKKMEERLNRVKEFDFGSSVQNHMYIFQMSDEEFLKRKKEKQGDDPNRSPDRFDSFKEEEQLRIVKAYRDMFSSATEPLRMYPNLNYTSLKHQIRDFTTHFNL
jgi:thymidylate kinase